MLDLRQVIDELPKVERALARRGGDAVARLAALEPLAGKRRALIAEVEEGRRKLNEASRAMAQADKQSDSFATMRAELKQLGEENGRLGAALSTVEEEIQALLRLVPNLPSEDTPDGLVEEDNPVLRVVGTRPEFPFKAKDHVELGTKLGLLDFERAAKISGARFVVLRGAGARLERALMQWMLDVHTDEHGYEEHWLPQLVLNTALEGTGQLPKFASDLFRIEALEEESEAGGATTGTTTGATRDLYLSPTAEVPLTNLHSGEILSAADLPRRLTAYSACFRSEAGSYGRDTRGMIRNHQFDKVELVHLCAPEQGEAELETLTGHAEVILQRLGLHYRVVQHCAGELGFSAQKAYDLEVWLPGQEKYREISSCSLCGSFQARRAKLRYRPADSGKSKAKPQLLHTLNGSALAIGRTVVALLEQGQQADGSVRLPEVLAPYMGGRTLLEPR